MKEIYAGMQTCPLHFPGRFIVFTMQTYKKLITELYGEYTHSSFRIIRTDEDPSLRIESSAIINLRGVSTKLNKYN